MLNKKQIEVIITGSLATIIGGIILLLIGFLLGLNTNQTFNNQNSTFNSPIIQGEFKDSIISINSSYISDSIDPTLYSQIITWVNQGTYQGLGQLNLYNIKLILPDGQEAYIEKLLFGERIDIAQCNEVFTDCVIYYKFRAKIPDKELCWLRELNTTKIDSKTYIISEIIKRSNRYITEPEKCFSHR